MKTVQSRRLDAYQMSVPVRGGYQVNFEGGRATVPNDVAEILVALGAGFYTVLPDQITEPGPVLVIRDMGLGDMLLITPLLRLLAAQGCTVDVQTLSRYQCLFDGNPAVRSMFSLEASDADLEVYHAVLDLRQVVENEERSGNYQHRVNGFAAAADVVAGTDQAERKLDYFVTSEELSQAQGRMEILKRDASSGTLAYVWRASAENRTWSEVTHKNMLAALTQKGWGVVILDQDPQAQSVTDPAILNLSGQLSIRETAAIMACCDAALTPDTGLFHMAGALNIPTVAYFGPFPAEERQTHKRLTVLHSPENCGLLPCRSYRCLNRSEDFQSSCLDLTPMQVIEALEQIKVPNALVHGN